MPELRQNFISKEWVIIATERAKRPEELATHRPAQAIPAFVETCVFCRAMRAKRRRRSCLLRAGPVKRGSAGDSHKFAALSSEVQSTRSLQHLRRRIDGFGFQEVIIDSPDHSRCLAPLPDEHGANIRSVDKQRYNALSGDHRVTTSSSKTMAPTPARACSIPLPNQSPRR
jgi:UDPglucose--hexose-1-phosphate uridylyltransferase